MPRIVKKFEERKKEIIKTARYLFQTKNYNNTSMQDLINELNIAKGTLYYYFKSKDALLEAVIENIANENIERMENLLKHASGNALEKMKLIIESSNMAEENPDLLEQLHQPGNETMHLRLLANALIKLSPIYAKLIQQGCDEKIFQTTSPLECAEFILAAIQFLTDPGIYPWSQDDLMRRMKAFPHIIEQQLNAPTGSFQFLATLAYR